MKAKDMMKENCICIEPRVSLQAAAELMSDNDCGALPVVKNAAERKPLVGIITDRDIAVRAVARGASPEDSIEPYMSHKTVTAAPDQDMEEVQELMSKHKIRRLPVVDNTGKVAGILTAAQLVRNSDEHRSGEYIKSVSEKTKEPSVV